MCEVLSRQSGNEVPGMAATCCREGFVIEMDAGEMSRDARSSQAGRSLGPDINMLPPMRLKLDDVLMAKA